MSAMMHSAGLHSCSGNILRRGRAPCDALSYGLEEHIQVGQPRSLTHLRRRQFDALADTYQLGKPKLGPMVKN
jgi:hypothetical protein